MVSRQRRRGPDRNAALDQYRRRIGVYDLEIALFEPLRRESIERLALRTGEVVLDVGCGTGLSFAQLRAGVGEAGRVVGIEQSPEMIGKARERAAAAGWHNVELIGSPVESAPLKGLADAALFQFTHDIVRNAHAVDHVLRHLKPGARVVACGLKWIRGWARAGNLFVLPAALRSVTTFEGLDAPWSHLSARAGPLQIDQRLLGAVYIASGRMPARN